MGMLCSRCTNLEEKLLRSQNGLMYISYSDGNERVGGIFSNDYLIMHNHPP